MLTATASAISASFCGVLKIHLVFASAGFTICADAASEIIGVPVSTATSRIASDAGVVDEPMMTSTLSSLTSFFALLTAFVVSDASSSTTQLIFSPPIDAGNRSIVFFCGMPSDAAGPVVEIATPMVTSASAGSAKTSAKAATSAGNDFGVGIELLRYGRLCRRVAALSCKSTLFGAHRHTLAD